MGLIQEFKTFALKGNVVDMAVGIVIGAAFGKIVSSFVNDVLMPPLGVATGGIDFADKKLVLKAESIDATGATIPATAINYGTFINIVIDFVIVAFAIFLVIKAMNAMKRKEAVAPSVPVPPSKEEVLLTEIRDLLKQR
jgi:large conductance mechanosensitive channel